MEDYHKKLVIDGVHTLRQLTEKNDFWIKFEQEGRDVLAQHKYQQAFPWWNKNLSWTTEASRASVVVKMHHRDLAERLAECYREMQATSLVVPNRKFTVLISCTQIDQGTWIIAEISHVPSPNTYRRVPFGCLIQRILEAESKVTWVEHTKVIAESPPNQAFYDHLIRTDDEIRSLGTSLDPSWSELELHLSGDKFLSVKAILGDSWELV
ncbi:homeobox-leucine zipper protein ROC8 [Tanacetum coccineum]